VTVVTLCILHFIAVLSVSLHFIFNKSPESTGWWANFLGVQATILASLQYLPQLWTTWKLKHVGSLSIPMMCIQTPGSFVWAISLAMREGTKWSSWLVYVVTGSLQGMLLAMCIAWEVRARKSEPAETRPDEGDEVYTERTALLR